MADSLCTKLSQDLPKFSSSTSTNIPTLTINSLNDTFQEYVETEGDSKLKRKGGIRKREKLNSEKETNPSSNIRNESTEVDFNGADDVVEEPGYVSKLGKEQQKDF